MGKIKVSSTQGAFLEISGGDIAINKKYTPEDFKYIRNTIKDMLAISDIEDGDICFVKGYHSVGDGGGGCFYWDANEDKANHNGGTIIDPNIAFPTDWNNTTQQSIWFTAGTGTGCWKRIYSGAVNVKWFGAKEDGNDQVALVQAAIDSAETIYIPRDVYYNRSALTNTETKLIVDDSTGVRVTNHDFWWKPGPTKPEIIAHRGFALLAPENTMTAFSNAVAMGAGSLECDVHMSSDGVPVIIHDSTVDRTTNGTGSVKFKTLVELQELDAGSSYDSIFSSSYIPTFAEFLDYAKSKSLKVYPEIKGYRTQTDINIMLQAVVDAGMETQTVFQSGSLSDLQYIRNLNKTVGVGFLTGSIDNLEEVSRLGGNVYMLLNYQSVLDNPTWIETIRSRGVDVAVWTVNNDSIVMQLYELGVTKIMSDLPVYGTNRPTEGNEILVDTEWGPPWETYIIGNATYTVDDKGVFTVTDPDTAGQIRKLRSVPLSGGDTIEIEVWARISSGTGYMWVDCPGWGNLVNSQRITTKDFRKYTMRVVIPKQKGNNTGALVVFGTYTAEIGTVHFFSPKIRVSGNKNALQTLACGLIIVPQGGAPYLHENVIKAGVSSLDIEEDGSTIRVSLSGNFYGNRPILTVTCTPDNAKICTAGNFDINSNSFLIRVYNFDGTRFTYNSGTTYIYFKVES